MKTNPTNPSFDNGKVVPGEVLGEPVVLPPRTLRGDIANFQEWAKSHPVLAAVGAFALVTSVMLGGKASSGPETPQPGPGQVCVTTPDGTFDFNRLEGNRSLNPGDDVGTVLIGNALRKDGPSGKLGDGISQQAIESAAAAFVPEVQKANPGVNVESATVDVLNIPGNGVCVETPASNQVTIVPAPEGMFTQR